MSLSESEFMDRLVDYIAAVRDDGGGKRQRQGRECVVTLHRMFATLSRGDVVDAADALEDLRKLVEEGA